MSRGRETEEDASPLPFVITRQNGYFSALSLRATFVRHSGHAKLVIISYTTLTNEKKKSNTKKYMYLFSTELIFNYKSKVISNYLAIDKVFFVKKRTFGKSCQMQN